jgi:hypothetical protein
VANFTLIRALGFSPLTRLLASEMQQISVNGTKTINAADGSSHAPSSQIVIGGSGLKLTGATALELDATSVATQDADGIFNWNGVQNVGANAQVNFAGSSGSALAELELNEYSVLDANSLSSVVLHGGSKLTVINGTAFTMNSTMTVEAGTGLINLGGTSGSGALNVNASSSLTVNGTSGSDAQLFIGEYGILQVGTGSVTGAFVQVWGGNTFAMFPSSFFDIDSGCTATLQLDHTSSITMASGSSASFAGTNTFGGTNALSGPTTQTGSFTKSGNGAWTSERVLHITLNGGTHNIPNPQDYDLIVCNGSGGGSAEQISLTVPSGLPDGIRLRVSLPQFTTEDVHLFVIGTYNGSASVDCGGNTGGTTAFTGWADLELVTLSGTQQWICVAQTLAS